MANIFSSIGTKISLTEEYLGGIPNTLILLTLIISILALIVSVIAFKVSNLEPALSLRYNVYQTEDYYENEKGSIKFSADLDTLDDTDNTIEVSITVPETSLNLILENKGKVSAKYPAIYMKFNGFRILDAFNDEWRLENHYRGVGGWGVTIWEPKDNTVVHPGIPINFYQLDFSRAIFDLDSHASIDITLVADGFRAKTIKIPVEIYDMSIGKVLNKK